MPFGWARVVPMNRRVLIVDDEPDVLELVEFKLTGQGFDVIRAATGVEALRKARCESPEVIVLDLLLPDLDGLSVCEIDRKSTRLNSSHLGISYAVFCLK